VTSAGGAGGVEGVELDDALSVRRFLDLSIDLLAILGLDTTIVAASQSWERTLGWAPATVVGSLLLDYMHPDDLPRIESELSTLLGGGDAVAVVVRVRASDGTYRWVQGNARSDLAAGRIYVTAADITERMALEDALRRQIGLEELVASIAARLIGAEHDLVPAEIERGIGELAQALGADRAHFLRGSRRPEEVTYVEWLHPETGQRTHTPAPHPEVQRWWRDGLRSGALIRVEDLDELERSDPLVVEALREEGVQSVVVVPLPSHRRFWGFLALVAIRDKVHFSDDATALLRLAGECFMTALAQGDDAVALFDARRELEHRNDELERTNEELERFAFAAAHDLKAPLARVDMALGALSTAAGAGVPSDQLLDVARRATSRMGQLIEDLLAFAAAGPSGGAMGTVDLDSVLTHVLGDLEAQIASGGVRVERSPLPTVTGNEALLGQLLQNLLANAIKFRRDGVDPVVQIDGHADPDGVTISVRDNGIGIAPEHRNEVFGVFTRLNAADSYTGSGIGLATCAKVVNHHRGRIWVEEGLDGGTAMVVWLPSEAPAVTS
jgi:PAS domain S-box-containing protein